MDSSVQALQPHCKIISSHALTLVARAATATIYDGRGCIGFILRGKIDYEVFDRDGVSKGRFPTQQDAVAALMPDRGR